ncbi:MAG: hypothetical protein AW07_02212 [Candidatus Accumulibacter sp. SK-11]|nr:MAG: hypothetical protein AW07_02212 [Candidatus Accumulibacter sp. SK-11]
MIGARADWAAARGTGSVPGQPGLPGSGPGSLPLARHSNRRQDPAGASFQPSSRATVATEAASGRRANCASM